MSPPSPVRPGRRAAPDPFRAHAEAGRLDRLRGAVSDEFRRIEGLPLDPVDLRRWVRAGRHLRNLQRVRAGQRLLDALCAAAVAHPDLDVLGALDTAPLSDDLVEGLARTLALNPLQRKGLRGAAPAVERRLVAVLDARVPRGSHAAAGVQVLRVALGLAAPEPLPPIPEGLSPQIEAARALAVLQIDTDPVPALPDWLGESARHVTGTDAPELARLAPLPDAEVAYWADRAAGALPLAEAVLVGRDGGGQCFVCVPTAVGARGLPAVLELDHDTGEVRPVADDLVDWVVRLAWARWAAARGADAGRLAQHPPPRVTGLPPRG